MKKTLLFSAIVATTASLTSAQVMVTYEFNDGSTEATATVSTIVGSDPDIAATSLTAVDLGTFNGNPGWGVTPSAPTFNGTSYGFIRGSVLNATDPGAGNFDYLGFTVSANTGAFNVTGASVQARITGTGPFNFALRSEVDGFTTDLLSGTTSSTTFANFENTTISGLSNLTDTEFRFYMWGNGGVVGRIDNLSLTTTSAAIPEPSTYALVASTLAIGLVALRRRRA